MKARFNKVAIAGMGLMGGSLGRALLERKLALEVTGVGRNIKKLKLAMKKRAATSVTTDYKAGFSGADIIVLSVPVDMIPEIFRDNYRFMDPSCVVTDMGSVKGAIVGEIEKIEKSFPGRRNIFVGSHPMVGSEKTGIANSSAGMYEGGTCIITPTVNTDKKRVEVIRSVWKALGMKTVEMTPGEHDEKISGVSHLPHMLAFLLSNMEAGVIKNNREIIGNGFRDTTRIGASSEEIWGGIFMENKKALSTDIDRAINGLNKMKALLAGSDINGLKRYIRNARKTRELLNK
jgi:prephenate dehydrogenase